jgi:hypothetical protein
MKDVIWILLHNKLVKVTHLITPTQMKIFSNASPTMKARTLNIVLKRLIDST